MAEQQDRKKTFKVLVVDDHPLTRNMVKAILRGMGFEHVTQADDGGEALDLLTSEHFDLVVCDWNMPGTTGIMVLRDMRSREKTKSIPFLMLTAEAYRENVTEAMNAGVTDYIIKPFTAEVLGDKVNRILGIESKRPNM